jgi:hypothetical protein
MNAVGLWLIKEQTIGSAVSTVTVTSAFSADYDVYKITITGGSASADDDLRFNFDGNTAGYYNGTTYVLNNSGFGNANGVGNNNQAFWLRIGRAGTNYIDLSMEVRDPFATKRSSFNCAHAQFTNGGAAFTSQGYHDSATSFTGFRIATSSGTMTGGVIRVYGYKIG